MVSTKKKAASAAAAVGVAAALALGGTFAWQSISQTALNEASDVVNPGGRLHDDFYIDDNGDYNADIYVENFAEDDIFARVRLGEYMEVVVNQGVEGAETVETIAGGKYDADGNPVTDAATDNVSGYDYEYATHYFDSYNATEAFWTWTAGGLDSDAVYYMPTFNKNKDSLVADRNGMYVDRIGGISNRGREQYEGWTVWAQGDSREDDAIYDADPNSLDEVGFDFEDLQTYVEAGNVATVTETHDAAPVNSSNGLVSMDLWLSMLNAGADTADFWVYDEDGWVYWSSPIAAGGTTGLLLDSVELCGVMDDTWYYAIEATGQFVTADDAGKADGTGFYADGEAPSVNAEILLQTIGVTLDEGGDDAFAPQAGTLGGVDMKLYFDDEAFSVDEQSSTLTVNTSVGDWRQGVVTLTSVDVPDLSFSQTTNALYKMGSDGDWVEEGTEYVDIVCYADENQIDVYCAEGVAGQYKIVSTYTGDDGSSYQGSIEFTIVEVSAGYEGGESDDPAEETPYLMVNGSMDAPLALPVGTTVSLSLGNAAETDGVTYYLIDYESNKDLEKDENGLYTTELQEKDGLEVIEIPTPYIGGEVVTQYYYGRKIGDSWIAAFSDGVEGNELEGVTFVALDADGGVVATATTKLYSKESHVYVGHNGNAEDDESIWYLVFEALDDNGGFVGYCVANAIQIPVQVDPLLNASVTPGASPSEYSVGAVSEDECDGTHAASVTEGLKLYAGDTELASVSVGRDYSDLSVKDADGTEQSVSSWSVRGNKSSGTAIDSQGALTVGHFESAGSITVLATIGDDVFAVPFTVTVEDETTLADASGTYVLARQNGSALEDGVVAVDGEWWPGSMHQDNFLLPKSLFEKEGIGTLWYYPETEAALEKDLVNLSSVELVGDDLNALTLTGSKSYDDGDTVYYGITGDVYLTFRAADYEVSETHSLYIITADEYVKHDFVIVESSGE